MKNIFFVFIAFFAVACTQQPQFVRISGHALGTYYLVSYYHPEGKNYQAEIDSILGEFLFVASLHEPKSEINAVNNNVDIVLSPMFQDIFNKAVSISEITDGAFDFTVGPLVRAFGFWNTEREEMTDEKIAEYLELVDFRGIQIVDGRAVKRNPNIKIDFNAIAKGYAVDLVGEFLESRGIEIFLISIGGDALGRGVRPNGNCWRVGIETPAETFLSRREVETVVQLCNSGLVTSGTYRRYFEQDGRRFSHTIDPTTGRPVEHSLLSVSVRDTYAWRADAFATAFMVLGVEKSLEMLKNLPGVEAFFISSGDNETFVITQSEGF
ncbi:MAG: FAD:protein FMN transferase [Bacteroidales bacterium]|nr:FAD:protein FMN transferase [Bacteroidales bacterium]